MSTPLPTSTQVQALLEEFTATVGDLATCDAPPELLTMLTAFAADPMALLGDAYATTLAAYQVATTKTE